MPLGTTPILQNELMAEGDNSKYLLFNDALTNLEDSVNRAVTVDLSAADLSLTQDQVLRYAVVKLIGHTAARTVQIPISVGSPPEVLNRKLAIRNEGTAAVTVTHNVAGEDIVIPAGDTTLVYADGTDIISLGGGGGGASVSLLDDGSEVIAALLSLNIAGGGVSITDGGGGAATMTFSIPENLTDLGDVVSDYTGHGGKSVTVKLDETGVEFTDVSVGDTPFKGTYLTEAALTAAHPDPDEGSYAYVDSGSSSDVALYIWDESDTDWVSAGSAGSAETASTIKTKYESNANTNALTDALLTKINSSETGATADLTAPEIESLLDTYYGDTDWRTGGGGGGGGDVADLDDVTILPVLAAADVGRALGITDVTSGVPTYGLIGDVPELRPMGGGVVVLVDLDLASSPTDNIVIPDIHKYLSVVVIGYGVVGTSSSTFTYAFSTDGGATTAAHTSDRGRMFSSSSGGGVTGSSDDAATTTTHFLGSGSEHMSFTGRLEGMASGADLVSFGRYFYNVDDYNHTQLTTHLLPSSVNAFVLNSSVSLTGGRIVAYGILQNAQPMELPFEYSGTPAGAGTLATKLVAYDYVIRAGASGAAFTGTGPTAEEILDLRLNGVSFGSVVLATDGTAIVSIPTETQTVSGDIVTLYSTGVGTFTDVSAVLRAEVIG